MRPPWEMDHSPGFLAHVEGRRPNVHEVSGRAARAIHVARGVIERDIEKLVADPATPVYLYCGGGFRSLLSADSLQQMGYTNVHSVIGGWRGWQELGAPVEMPDTDAP